MTDDIDTLNNALAFALDADSIDVWSDHPIAHKADQLIISRTHDIPRERRNFPPLPVIYPPGRNVWFLHDLGLERTRPIPTYLDMEATEDEPSTDVDPSVTHQLADEICTVLKQTNRKGEVRTWLDFVQTDLIPIKPERGKAIIAPISMTHTDRMFLGAEQPDDELGLLPPIPTLGKRRFPSLPIDLYEASGARIKTTHRGAPIEQRIWLGAAMSIPIQNRGDPGANYSLRRTILMTLREIMAIAYPDSRFERNYHVPRISGALKRVSSIYIPLPTSGAWQVVNVRKVPDYRSDLDSPDILLEIALPGGNQRGALVLREVLFGYGKSDVHAFRAYLRLVYFWNHYISNRGKLQYPTIPKVVRNQLGQILDRKGKVILNARGEPTKNWDHNRAVRTGDDERNPAMDRLPLLTADDLIELVFDNHEAQNYGNLTKRQRQRRRHEIDLTLQRLIDDEILEISRSDNWLRGDIQLLPGKRNFEWR